jgi:hypothetical protein
VDIHLGDQGGSEITQKGKYLLKNQGFCQPMRAKRLFKRLG